MEQPASSLIPIASCITMIEKTKEIANATFSIPYIAPMEEVSAMTAEVWLEGIPPVVSS